MKISFAQIPITNDKAINVEAMARACTAAAKENSSLVLFPEVAMWYQPGATHAVIEHAETVPGPFTEAIDALAKHHAIAIAVGMYEKSDSGDRAYNTVYVASPQGLELARYRKVHLYDAFGLRESDVVAPSGSLAPKLFELDGVRFGLMICYDLRFPESARLLADAKADVILLSALWMPGPRKEDHWSTLIRARAIENTVYMLACNGPATLSFGASMAVDPMGNILTQSQEGADVQTVDITTSRIAEVRLTNPSLSNRRFGITLNAPEPAHLPTVP
ncbi:carbon-nitrogen hydrolase family protein [Mesorhizobium sp. 2RAF21]|uniref:carbon-nitrogen hydrolase family protein n=1 Tax=Mesorhizobium sp. 2RAF21 TaxID=3232995 RepID=UPI003F9E83AC